MTDADRMLAKLGEIAGIDRLTAESDGFATLRIDGREVHFSTARDVALEMAVETGEDVARDPSAAARLLAATEALPDGMRYAAEPGRGRVFLCAPVRDGDAASLTSQVDALLRRAATPA